MKIRFTQCLAGTVGVWHPGEVADFDDAEAVRLIEAEIAIPEPGAAESAKPAATEKRSK